MGVVAQIGAYLIAVVLPVLIFGIIGALLSWKLALLCLVTPMALLGLYGLARDPG